MWLLENEGEALEGKMYPISSLLDSIADNMAIQVNGFGCGRESAIYLVELSPNV